MPRRRGAWTSRGPGGAHQWADPKGSSGPRREAADVRVADALDQDQPRSRAAGARAGDAPG
eukprot:4940315-Pyramimonas_sp.AAC.1